MDNGKLYYVLPSDMAKELDFEALSDSSYETIRYSLDRTMCVVEYRGNLAVRGGSYYTHEEALELMTSAEWLDPDDPANL